METKEIQSKPVEISNQNRIEQLRQKFPFDFPIEFLPLGAKEESISVFRICRSGAVEPRSFLPSHLDPDVMHVKELEDAEFNIENYSLSVYEKANHARRRLALFSRYSPAAIAARGTTDPSCGLTQRSSERTGKKGDSHVDWWLYEGAKPHIFFEAVDLQQLK